MTATHRLCLCLSAVLLLFVPSTVTAASPVGISQQAGGDGSISISCVSPELAIVEESDSVAVSAEGWALSDTGGEAQLPYATAMIVLPSDAEATLVIESLAQEELTLTKPVVAAPFPVAGDDGQQPTLVYEDAPAVWDGDLEPVTLTDLGIRRGLHLGLLTYYPAVVRDGSLLLTSGAAVRVEWGEAISAASITSTLDRLQQQTALQALNGANAQAVERDVAVTAQTWSAGWPTAYLDVEQAGIYRLEFSDALATAGLEAAPVDSLHLLQGDQELALYVATDANGQFDAGDVLYAYVVPRHNRYAAGDVLGLYTDSSTPGRRMATRAAQTGMPTGSALVTRVFEENHIYTPAINSANIPLLRDGDRWAWQAIALPAGSGSSTFSYDFDLADVQSSSAGELTIHLLGNSRLSANPDHRVSVALNGVDLGDVTWDGRELVAASLPVPGGVLQTADNHLLIEAQTLSGVTFQTSWIDAIEVTYARSTAAKGQSVEWQGSAAQQSYPLALASLSDTVGLDTTNSAAPVWLTGLPTSGQTFTVGDPDDALLHSYAVAAGSGILTPSRVRAAHDPWFGENEPTEAEMIVITPSAWASTARKLVDYRQANGTEAVLVDLDGLYDVYGDGRVQPEAIQAFIAHAYADWVTSPISVLLIGDASFDPRGYDTAGLYGAADDTFLPAWLLDVDPYYGETASDNRYACVDGDDNQADLIIGRLPVGSADELSDVIDKTVAYEAEAPDAWAYRAALVADDADSGGDFAAESDEAAASLPDACSLMRLYPVENDASTDDLDWDEGESMHNALAAAWNDGLGYVQYMGHAYWQFWGAEAYLHVDTVDDLVQQPRLPILGAFTCWTSRFQQPGDTLDELLVVSGGSGAIATWGATGGGLSSGHVALAEGLASGLFDSGNTIGEGVWSSQTKLLATGRHLDLLDSYVLLGDPSTRLPNAVELSLHKAGQLLDANANGLPDAGETVVYRLVLENGGEGTATEVVIADEPQAPGVLVPGTVQTSAGVVACGNADGDTTVRVEIAALAATDEPVVVTFAVILSEDVTNALENQAQASCAQQAPVSSTHRLSRWCTVNMPVQLRP